MNIQLKIKEKMVFIEARERPIILKVTSLQLILLLLNSSKSSSFVSFPDRLSDLQMFNSLKKPCSIPKW